MGKSREIFKILENRGYQIFELRIVKYCSCIVELILSINPSLKRIFLVKRLHRLTRGKVNQRGTKNICNCFDEPENQM